MSIERVRRRDHADRERVLVAERAADRGHRLADGDGGSELPSGTGTSACADGSTWIRPTSSEDVPADDLGPAAVAVAELDVHACRPGLADRAAAGGR